LTARCRRLPETRPDLAIDETATGKSTRLPVGIVRAWLLGCGLGRRFNPVAHLFGDLFGGGLALVENPHLDVPGWLVG
jgi:hypothetical protein